MHSSWANIFLSYYRKSEILEYGLDLAQSPDRQSQGRSIFDK